MPSLEQAYWIRQPVLLEACELLQRGVSDSFGDQSGCRCDFRIIELSKLFELAQATIKSGSDAWSDSAELISGTITIPKLEQLEYAWEIIEKLFTIQNRQDSTAIVVVPPWAKPAAWQESLTLPSHLTIRFQVDATSPQVEEPEIISLFQPLTLSLSGGGVRAAIYQLGILVFLSKQNRLKDVQEIVSVSGGSILAAHFLKHWPAAIGRESDFRKVAAELLQICRSDIRNRIFVPWLWSRLLPWSYFFRNQGRSGRLLGEYQRIFGATTLGELNQGCPKLAFVATDSVQHHRVAFTSSQILRWNFDDEEDSVPAPILSKGVELSLAVAASSCFPPVFPRLHLDHQDLGITYREFKQQLYLNDGGVVTNLGIEVLIALRSLGWTKGKLILIADAERILPVKPGDSPLVDADATFAALGKSARESARREFGTSAIPIPFTDRVERGDSLPFRVETAMFNYRTDLDAPTWQEIHGLMVHGAMVASQSTQDRFEPVDVDALKKTISTIIAEAGGPPQSPLPNEADFLHSGRRSYVLLWMHGILATILVVSIAMLAYCTMQWIRNAPSHEQKQPALNSSAANSVRQRQQQAGKNEAKNTKETHSRKVEQVAESNPKVSPASAEIIGQWNSYSESSDLVRREPPKDELVVASASKSFAKGIAEAKLAKGGPSGAFVWAYLHGVHLIVTGAPHIASRF
ncbi:patatin-like phospholipase family protein [Bremerella alba]|uniref:PNPLA domain-containing protein n=1 Tax=Bremerella alba TaxID=980252 RepID=A0A7V8V7H3_9BACT|nr:patatin-like phospholipase family protein [Bremerella alba]MBA2116094.1 hypothetical protein [Bremerella alba]